MILAATVTIAAIALLGMPGVSSASASAAPAMYRSAPAASEATPCPANPNVGHCDADADRIADQLERQLCGTATCATSSEDTDGDGIPDWVEYTACRTTTCADPGLDTDGNGIPDYISEIICGTATCTDGLETLNPHGVQQWISVLICGDITCATGTEDLNGDGVPDAAQLLKRYLDLKAAREAAEAARLRALAHTGLTVVLPIGAGLLVAAGGMAALLAWRRQRRLADPGELDLDGGHADELARPFAEAGE
ncbi:hypothetical protein B7R21_07670 [Subtercola boreus]|uniref:Uncharacterized protein n=1 Tax=Subtercola boreus TaxID=120213 RepID=A0A3E0VWK0_9MICO|nr:hypothetical protein B7R21_07670 [Subtercola boreus]